MQAKTLMVITDASMRDLHAGRATAMNYYIVQTPFGILAVLESAEAMPLYFHSQFYCIDDLLAGIPIPRQRSSPQAIVVQQTYPSRHSAIAALHSATISSAFTGATGAFPLIASYTLAATTVFCRYSSSSVDHRYSSSGQLSAGTYLTSRLDRAHADSGFGAVGRYALPIPLPASHVIEYELAAGTVIEVGTVAPNFGQAGGGVEIHLLSTSPATQLGATVLPEY